MGIITIRRRQRRPSVRIPFNKSYPERIYRTGDLGKYDREGPADLCLRRDYQIKHQGHRIELGEIEAAAFALPAVKACACVYDRGQEVICLFTRERTPATKRSCGSWGKSFPATCCRGGWNTGNSFP